MFEKSIKKYQNNKFYFSKLFTIIGQYFESKSPHVFLPRYEHECSLKLFLLWGLKVLRYKLSYYTHSKCVGALQEKNVFF